MVSGGGRVCAHARHQARHDRRRARRLTRRTGRVDRRKLTRWSSTTADGQPAFDRDLLLSTLTLYWATRTGASSLLPYWAYRNTPASALPADDPAPAQTAIDIFGGEIVPFPKPPRDLAERYFNVVAWSEHGRGGHFPAVAEPQLLADRLRNAFRPYRDLAAWPH